MKGGALRNGYLVLILVGVVVMVMGVLMALPILVRDVGYAWRWWFS